MTGRPKIDPNRPYCGDSRMKPYTEMFEKESKIDSPVVIVIKKHPMLYQMLGIVTVWKALPNRQKRRKEHKLFFFFWHLDCVLWHTFLFKT